MYFLLSRGKSQEPTKLNMKANEDFSKSIIKTELQPSGEAEDNQKKPDFKIEKMTILEPENVVQMKDHVAKSKTLSIYFMYNGHEWEAHEVLGVPAGASMPQVTESYQKLIITSDPSTFSFYESAYQAILKRWRDRL